MPIVQATDVPLQPFPTGRTSPQAPADYQQIPTDVSEFGALQGQALEKLGAGVEKLATGVGQIAAYQQHVFDQTELTKMRMREDDAIYDASWGATDPATGKKVGKGFLDLYGSEATDVGPPKKQLDDARDAIAASAPNDRVRQMFLQQSRAARQAADNRFAAHYSQQLEHAQEDTNKGVILQSGRDAGTARNDDEFEDAVNKGRVGAAGTKDPVTNGLLADDHNTGSYIAAQIAKGNYAEADRILKKYGHFLTGDRQKTYADALLAHNNRDLIRGLSAEANGDAPPSGRGGGGQFRAPPGAAIEGANPAEQRMLNEFRHRESSGNYGLIHEPVKEGPYQGQTAKGAYGFLDETWKEATKAAGVGTEYATADKAPPAVQDAVALSYFRSKGTQPWKSSGPYPGDAGSQADFARTSGTFGSPEQAGRNLTTVTAPGGASFQVHQKAAPQIQGFVNELEGLGYKIDPATSGGYNNRNKVGVNTNEKSEHAFGSAIDINPDRNKQDDKLVTDLPSNISQIAAKWGLKWGGDFEGKKDAMHFEVAQLLPGGKPTQLAFAAPAATSFTDVAPGAPASTAPQAGPKPMRSLDDVLRNAGEIADREGLNDDQRDALIRRAGSDHSLKKAKLEDQRKRLSDELVNGEALLKDGRPFSYDEAKLRSLVEPAEADKIVGALKDAEDQGAANIAVGRLSPGEAQQWRDALSRDIEKYPQGAAKRIRYLQHFDAAMQQRNAQLHNEGADPATYLITRDQKFPSPGGPPSIADLHKAAFPETGPMNPVAFQAYASATLAEQARLGVLPEKQNVLPKPQAAALATYFAKTDPGTADTGAQLAQMQKQYGPYWDKAYGDMVKAGLPRETRVIAQMSQPEQGPARQDYQEMLKLAAEKGGMEKFKKTNFEEKDVTDMSREIRTNMDEFRRSSPVGAGLSEDMQSAAEHLALYYRYHGDDVNTAADKAYKAMVGYKYDFLGSGNQRLRVPKGYSGIVESAGDAVQHHILPSDLANNIPAAAGVRPETAQANMLDAVRNGYWQTNEADDGAVLYLRTRDGWHDIARTKDGQRVEFKWADARRLSQFAPPLAVPGMVGPGGEYAPPLEDRGFTPLGYRGLMLGGPPT